MTNVTPYPTRVDMNRLPSHRLWKEHFNLNKLRDWKSDGLFLFDDFIGGGSALATNDVAWRGADGYAYDGFVAAGGTMNQVAPSADDPTIGELRGMVDATTEEAYLSGDTTYGSPLGKISNTAGKNFMLGFETRVKFNNVANTAGSAKMVGLSQEGLAATGAIASGGASIGANDFIGFRALIADGDGMDAVHVDAAEVVIAEAANEASLVIVADTYKKFGIFFDGTKVFWYVDGVPLATTVLPAATNFPDASMLAPFWGIRNVGVTGETTFTVDWVAMGWMSNP